MRICVHLTVQKVTEIYTGCSRQDSILIETNLCTRVMGLSLLL